jgi:hypothetical protein
MNASELRIKGMQLLLREFGKVDAEMFISLMLREPFDYTQWHKGSFKEIPLEELSKSAMQYSAEKPKPLS